MTFLCLWSSDWWIMGLSYTMSVEFYLFATTWSYMGDTHLGWCDHSSVDVWPWLVLPGPGMFLVYLQLFAFHWFVMSLVCMYHIVQNWNGWFDVDETGLVFVRKLKRYLLSLDIFDIIHISLERSFLYGSLFEIPSTQLASCVATSNIYIFNPQ